MTFYLDTTTWRQSYFVETQKYVLCLCSAYHLWKIHILHKHFTILEFWNLLLKQSTPREQLSVADIICSFSTIVQWCKIYIRHGKLETFLSFENLYTCYKCHLGSQYTVSFTLHHCLHQKGYRDHFIQAKHTHWFLQLLAHCRAVGPINVGKRFFEISNSFKTIKHSRSLVSQKYFRSPITW